MKDYIVRATAAEGQVRAFAATTKELVETAREHHNTSPVATAALGRLLTAGAMMGSMMKNETDMLTLQVRGDGPLGGITVTADSKGDVKGYVNNPDVMLPPKNGKLDVGGAVGIGLLQVIKDMGLKEPYSGQTILVSSEIAEDLTYYFANSEQVPSSVGLGVLMEKDNTVECAGGFIIQMMPFAKEETISQIEENLKNKNIHSILDLGCGTGALLKEIKELNIAEQLFGIDISPNMLEIAKNKLGNDATLILGDSERLPFEDSSFDAIVCNDSFHHYPQPDIVEKEVSRCLKQNGVFIIGDCWQPIGARQIMNYYMKHSNSGDVKIYSKKEMLLLLSKDFHEIEWKSFGTRSCLIIAYNN